ncbi:MAG: gamma carbonic anhydrase family protein [Archaeoglobaceae archaeon]
MIRGFKDKKPRISEDCFIADSAVVIGNVGICDSSSVWFNSVIRGDMEEIKIGSRTNIQDCAVVHSDPGLEVEIGDAVTIGHGSVVHGCKIEKNVIIGMNATVLNGAEIGKNSIVAANALIPPEKKFSQNSIIMGVPGVKKKVAGQSEVQMIQSSAEEYVKLAAEYKNNLK